MPSKNMLPKGKRRQTVKHEYRATRGVEPPAPPPIPVLEPVAAPAPVRLPIPVLDFDHDVETSEEDVPASAQIRVFTADPAAQNHRLDQYLAKAIPDISRARVQLLIESGQVKVDGSAAKASLKLRGGESIEIQGTPQPPPLQAMPEDIPLSIVHEDRYLAVIDKPAGMMVHAGSGAPTPTPDEPDRRSNDTLVNALLFHFNKLSGVGGELRPGIVHRLDKQTSGLIVVAKDDVTHRKLGEMFSERQVAKTYLALVHGHVEKNDITVSLPVGRDLVRRTRMTTRRPLGEGVRSAVSHIHVVERLSTPYGRFTLVEVRIETGRTHQIRVHMQSLGHPVVGDTLYGAPQIVRPTAPGTAAALSLDRNFLHAASLSFTHPRTHKILDLQAPLPAGLEAFLAAVRAGLRGVE